MPAPSEQDLNDLSLNAKQEVDKRVCALVQTNDMRRVRKVRASSRA